jgi:hypothetical protein
MRLDLPELVVPTMLKGIYGQSKISLGTIWEHS